MIDVDYFKEFNDTYGHVQGDVILKSVADSLMDNMPSDVFVARFGGDEFSCMCINKSDDEIINYIKSIQNNIKNKKIEHKGNKNNNYLTLSFGFYNGALTSSMLEKADEALYQSKSKGRNTFSMYAKEVH